LALPSFMIVQSLTATIVAAWQLTDPVINRTSPFGDIAGWDTQRIPTQASFREQLAALMFHR
jgi:hypothetical protein